MNVGEIKVSDLFEKIIIQDPSVIVCGWLLIQFLVLAVYLDSGFSNKKHGKSSVETWYGFWIFAPTYFFDIFIVVFSTFIQADESKSIGKAYGTVSLIKATNYSQLDNLEHNVALDDIGFNDPYIPGSGFSSIAAAEEEDGGKDYIDGYKMTPGDYARESALNRSLINKWLWTLPSFILASCKISFDKNDAYSWHLIFLPLYIYICVFLGVAVARNNLFMRKQRDIDREDRRVARELKKIREAVKEQLKETSAVDF